MAHVNLPKRRNLALCAVVRSVRRNQNRVALLSIRTSKFIFGSWCGWSRAPSFAVFKSLCWWYGRSRQESIVKAGMVRRFVGTGYFLRQQTNLPLQTLLRLGPVWGRYAVTLEHKMQGNLVTLFLQVSAYACFGAPWLLAQQRQLDLNWVKGSAFDVMTPPSKVTTIHPVLIRSEINEKVEKSAFIVDTRENWRKAMVNSHWKEKWQAAFVACMAWAIIPQKTIAPIATTQLAGKKWVIRLSELTLEGCIKLSA